MSPFDALLTDDYFVLRINKINQATYSRRMPINLTPDDTHVAPWYHGYAYPLSILTKNPGMTRCVVKLKIKKANSNVA